MPDCYVLIPVNVSLQSSFYLPLAKIYVLHVRVIIQHVDTSCVKFFSFSRVTRPVTVGVVLLSLYIGVIFKMLLNEILELLCTVQTKRQIDSFF